MTPAQSGKDALWIYPKLDPQLKESIVKEFKIQPSIAQILISRGFTSLDQIHKYLYAKLPDLYDPFLLSEMSEAVDRVCQALARSENILIYGDNDVDGMTGTALLTEFLQYIGAKVFFYISTRGLQRDNLIVEALEYALKNECKLLITVDCGITAAAEIAKVVEKGVDVIITDHHEPTDEIPHCIATLNSKQAGSQYPNRDITGVGVAFKLAHGVTNRLVTEGKISSKKIDLKRYLDLVALGTISDMGRLLDENRILVLYGLKQMRKTKRIGLAKLISVCDLELSDLSTSTIASKVAPRLNSLGRIADPQKGVELLLLRNSEAAEKMAQELDLNNIERQKIERTMSVDVDHTLNLHPEIMNDKAIVMQSDKWHPGVIAIISTRIAKQYNRPTAMIALENGIGKGSMRSIPEFPLLEALKSCSDLLINFGGHDFAAGLTIREQDIPEFKRRFIEYANNKLQDQDVLRKLNLDAEVNFKELSFDFMEAIRLLEPYGNDNPPPTLFCDATQAWPPKVMGQLKLFLKQEDRVLEGIAFGQAALAPLLRRKDLVLRVAYTPHVSEFQNKASIQLSIRDCIILEGLCEGPSSSE